MARKYVYMITEEEYQEIDSKLTEVRQLIRERKTFMAFHKITKIKDILLNFKKIGQGN